ncbi:MAG TPA: hypothetical protein VFA90_16475 [Terriglobales bacterium]|nr:hypothetical protein [Terriglobales bacterium]
MALAAAALILIVLGALLWIRTTTAVQTATIDLRERSVARGENPDSNTQSPIQLPLGTKHLVFDLPIGSQEGTYEVALLDRAGEETRSTTGIARLENHTVILKADIDLAGVSPGLYFLGIRQAGLEWTRYPVRVR